MKLFIVTGTSSGIGQALVKEIRQEFKNSNQDYVFIHGSRSSKVDSSTVSNPFGQSLREFQLSFDLSTQELSTPLFKKISEFWPEPSINHEIILIQNAGVLEPISMLHNADLDKWQSNFTINTLGPARVLQHMLKLQLQKKASLLAVHISSGAAKKGYPGWSAYCASKAGLEKMVESVAMECETLNLPSILVSLAPGVIDTPMQKQIRSASSQDFPNQQRFAQLYENDQLWKPSFVAQNIFNWINQSRDSIQTGQRYDLRDII
jgi:benzil reductase ((S)-benzoin forming)